MTRRKIHKRIITSEDEEKIVRLYKSGSSAKKILEALDYKVKTTKTVYDVLRKWEVPRKGGPSSYNPITHNYFSCIDSREKGYLLGFLVSDGWIHQPRNQVGLSLAQQDKWVVELFKKETKTAANIVVRPGGEKINPQGKKVKAQATHQVIVSSAKMIEDLKLLGICERKTGREILPLVNGFPQSHVLRGILDGDGTIYKHSNGKNTCVRFTGGPHLVAQISMYLHLSRGVEYQFPNQKGNENLWYVEWSREQDCQQITRYLYYESENLRLDRKYEKAKNLID